MNETNQEDMSVEDILSSIKNILVDENGAPIAEHGDSPAAKTPEPVLQNQQIQRLKPIDDVFDLDSSMIVDDNSATQDINRLLETPTEAPAMLQPEQQPAEPADKPVEKQFSTQTVKAAPVAQSIPEIKNPSREQPAPQPETENRTEHNAPAKSPTDTNKVSEETIDASAGIINNFAKLFAEKQQEANTTPAPTGDIAAKVEAAIAGQNISEMVKNTIVSQVRTCLDGNFEKIAAGIIAEQTQNWLNQNLAAIVEKTVAREIERVIAKVGS